MSVSTSRAPKQRHLSGVCMALAMQPLCKEASQCHQITFHASSCCAWRFSGLLFASLAHFLILKRLVRCLACSSEGVCNCIFFTLKCTVDPQTRCVNVLFSCGHVAQWEARKDLNVRLCVHVCGYSEELGNEMSTNRMASSIGVQNRFA
jgi:hypothetical protein